MLIPDSLLLIDETVEDVIVSGDDMTSYYDDIDSAIVADAFDVGVIETAIPVDVNGHVTSIRLRRLGQYYGIYRILRGYNGIGNGELDDIYSKWKDYYYQYLDERKKLTKESIMGGDGTTPPTMAYTLKNFPVTV